MSWPHSGINDDKVLCFCRRLGQYRVECQVRVLCGEVVHKVLTERISHVRWQNDLKVEALIGELLVYCVLHISYDYSRG